jgi:hypothetical protein
MNYTEIQNVKQALLKISSERLPIAYEIAKNLKLCNKIIAETDEIMMEIYKKYADKDEKGELRVYHDPSEKEMYKISDNEKLLEYQQALNKLYSEEHDVKFITISKTTLIGQSLYATDLLPLLDIIIVD